MKRATTSRAWALVALAAVLGIFVATPLLRRSSAAEDDHVRLVELDHRLAHLEERLAAREAAPPVASPRLAPASGARPIAVAEASGSEPAQEVVNEVAASLTDEEAGALLELLDEYLTQTASPEDQERLFETLRDGHTVAALLHTLEQQVAEDPHDLDTRMRLASAYVAKLFTVPVGPEMGIWGGKAETQWQAVLDRDARHWEARFRLATNYAYYPDVAGKTDDAIRHLETLRGQQEEGMPEPRQASVYTLLASLYRRQGDTKSANAVLMAGHQRHPDAVSPPSNHEGR